MASADGVVEAAGRRRHRDRLRLRRRVAGDEGRVGARVRPELDDAHCGTEGARQADAERGGRVATLAEPRSQRPSWSIHPACPPRGPIRSWEFNDRWARFPTGDFPLFGPGRAGRPATPVPPDRLPVAGPAKSQARDARPPTAAATTTAPPDRGETHRSRRSSPVHTPRRMPPRTPAPGAETVVNRLVRRVVGGERPRSSPTLLAGEVPTGRGRQPPGPRPCPLSSARRSVTASPAQGRARNAAASPASRRRPGDRARPRCRPSAAPVLAVGRHEIPLGLHVQRHDPGHPLPQRAPARPRRPSAACVSSRAAGQQVADVVHQPGDGQFDVVGMVPRASSAAVCSAWSSWVTGTPGLERSRSAPVASTVDDLVDAQTRGTAALSIPAILPRCGYGDARALVPTAAQPVDRQDGRARARPRRRRALPGLAAARGPARRRHRHDRPRRLRRRLVGGALRAASAPPSTARRASTCPAASAPAASSS